MKKEWKEIEKAVIKRAQSLQDSMTSTQVNEFKKVFDKMTPEMYKKINKWHSSFRLVLSKYKSDSLHKDLQECGADIDHCCKEEKVNIFYAVECACIDRDLDNSLFIEAAAFLLFTKKVGEIRELVCSQQ